MVPKHHNNVFTFLLSNSGQSQLYFGTKFILVGACVTKIRLNFVGKSRKLIFLPNALELTQYKGQNLCF